MCRILLWKFELLFLHKKNSFFCTKKKIDSYDYKSYYLADVRCYAIVKWLKTLAATFTDWRRCSLQDFNQKLRNILKDILLIFGPKQEALHFIKMGHMIMKECSYKCTTVYDCYMPTILFQQRVWLRSAVAFRNLYINHEHYRSSHYSNITFAKHGAFSIL